MVLFAFFITTKFTVFILCLILGKTFNFTAPTEVQKSTPCCNWTKR